MEKAEFIESIVNEFNFQGSLISFSKYGNGHINDTYLINCKEKDFTEKKYILQRINTNVFKNADALMNNIVKVLDYIEKQKPTDCTHRNLSIIKTKNSMNVFLDESNNHWRAYEFVENSITLQTPSCAKDFFKAGKAFGEFHKMLSNVSPKELVPTIPDFHNTKKRYSDFLEAIDMDSFSRVNGAREQIDFLKSRKHYTDSLDIFNKKLDLKIRTVHNDAKLNNILFDAKTMDVICIIDLDTVMPGIVHYDFGDAIRFGACTCDEDEPDLSKVGFNIELFKEFAKGYIIEVRDILTEGEFELLYVSPLVMTYENAIRFLSDHLNGDVYFKTYKENHNLYRCKVQIRLIEEMEKKIDQMRKIVKETK